MSLWCCQCGQKTPHTADIRSITIRKPSEETKEPETDVNDEVSNLEAAITNLYTCGLLTKYLYHGDGNLLVRLWRNTCPNQIVHIWDVEHIPPDIVDSDSDGFNKMPLQITKPAPQWKTTAVVNGEFKDIALSDYKGKYVVLFFYPLDFTFVCPTEIIAFSEKADDFRKIGCEIIAASTDSHFTHLAWINTPRKQGGLGPMNIPIIADKSQKISRDYGVLNEESGIPFRGLFIIDDKQNLRQITVNDLPVGRSVEETLRLVQAFQYTDKYGEVCPANWKPGSKTIKPDTKAAQEYFGDAN